MGENVSNTSIETLFDERLAVLTNKVAAIEYSTWVFLNLFAACIILIMQSGFAQYEAGTVRSHNVIMTLMKNMADTMCAVGVSLLFGYYLAYGSHPLFFDELSTFSWLAFVLHVAYQSTAVTIVSGAMSERTRLRGYIWIAVVVATSFCLASRFVWGGGWLAELGFLDKAGAAVTHIVGGSASFAGTIVVGPRFARWKPSMRQDFVPHDMTAVVTGAFKLLVSWIPFNVAGIQRTHSIPWHAFMGRSALNTVVMASSAALTSIPLSLLAKQALDITHMCNSMLSGLVASSSGCDVIDPCYSIIIGGVAALAYRFFNKLFVTMHIDDVVGAAAVHVVNGWWGCLATGLFHRKRGLFTSGDGTLLGHQVIGCLVMSAIGGVPAFVACLVLKRLGLLRVSAESELLGLDHMYGQTAYVLPQQTIRECRNKAMILRQYGVREDDLLFALKTLRNVICKPFTPQAEQNKLEGEVMDILHHFRMDEGRQDLAFICHHAKDAGDSAQLLQAALRRLVVKKFHKVEVGTRIWDQSELSELTIIDSSEVNDLSIAPTRVSSSMNFVLLLSKHTLEWPAALLELSTAVSTGRRVCLVLLEYAKKGDPRGFSFPEDLESHIKVWEEYCANEVQQRRIRRRVSSRCFRGSASFLMKHAAPQIM